MFLESRSIVTLDNFYEPRPPQKLKNYCFIIFWKFGKNVRGVSGFPFIVVFLFDRSPKGCQSESSLVTRNKPKWPSWSRSKMPDWQTERESSCSKQKLNLWDEYHGFPRTDWKSKEPVLKIWATTEEGHWRKIKIQTWRVVRATLFLVQSPAWCGSASRTPGITNSSETWKKCKRSQFFNQLILCKINLYIIKVDRNGNVDRCHW